MPVRCASSPILPASAPFVSITGLKLLTLAKILRFLNNRNWFYCFLAGFFEG